MCYKWRRRCLGNKLERAQGVDMSDSDGSNKLGFGATWSLVTGGMVGGGIYIALGVVIAVAGQWAWLSFVIAGLVALTTAYSYVQLATKFEEGGGAFEFLREIDLKGVAGSLSWTLLLGYVLTMSVYAYAFGHYVAYAFGFGPWLTRLCALGILALLVFLNLQGVGKATGVEIVIVIGNLAALLALAAFGLFWWRPVELTAGIEPVGFWAAPIGAATIFMSYEGFQLLTYEYSEIKNPQKTLVPAVLSGVVAVILIYVAVSCGATMIAGANTIVDQKEVALSVAARQAVGLPGLVVMTVAAAFATAAAINSTLFSTARLAKRVADDGELPKFVEHRNGNGIPDRAVMALGVFSALLASAGSLSTLVEAASLAFLFTFGAVNLIALRELEAWRWIPVVGTVLASIVALLLVIRLLLTALVPFLVLVGFVLVAVFVRPYILSKFATDPSSSSEAS